MKDHDRHPGWISGGASELQCVCVCVCAYHSPTNFRRTHCILLYLTRPCSHFIETFGIHFLSGNVALRRRTRSEIQKAGLTWLGEKVEKMSIDSNSLV